MKTLHCDLEDSHERIESQAKARNPFGPRTALLYLDRDLTGVIDNLKARKVQPWMLAACTG
jgi:hypothetical protein